MFIPHVLCQIRAILPYVCFPSRFMLFEHMFVIGVQAYDYSHLKKKDTHNNLFPLRK